MKARPEAYTPHAGTAAGAACGSPSVGTAVGRELRQGASPALDAARADAAQRTPRVAAKCLLSERFPTHCNFINKNITIIDF